MLNERVDSKERDRDRQPGVAERQLRDGKPEVAGIGKRGRGPARARRHIQAAQGYPTDHGGKRQPDQDGRADFQQLRVV